MTPDSVISPKRSLPSRVRSPTPAQTETPPCCSARRRHISCMMNLFATPGPPHHAGEDRVAAVLFGLAADHLLDDDRLAHAGAAEHPDLAALHVGLEQVDDLDAG